MMTFTMFCTSMLFDGRKGTILEIVRLGLCLSIGAYAYFQISLTDIAMSVIIYSVINILLLQQGFIGIERRFLIRAENNSPAG